MQLEQERRQQATKPKRTQWAEYRLGVLYRDACLPDKQWQRVKIEALRYRFCNYKHATRLIQILGDWTRAFGFAATVVFLLLLWSYVHRYAH